MSLLRQLPSVDRVQRELVAELGAVLPRVLVTDYVRKRIEAWREEVLQGQRTELPAEPVNVLRQGLLKLAQSRIRPVINATGVMIHTNLGRAPLGVDVAVDVAAVATGYSSIELDLQTGERGSRAALVEEALACLCEAEAATVVNNCAAGLVVTLRALMTEERREVVISRGELVEIGGGFRVPEIMQCSGATMREVGATNRTRLADYSATLSAQTALLLQVHRSNFRMTGFVQSVLLEDLVALGREHGLPVVCDLGSGSLLPTESLGMVEHEIMPREVIRAGADLVLFSGDKLLGGPQAGIIAGKKELIERIKKEPFFRAVRCDKLVLTALQSTALAYLEAQSAERPEVPAVRLMQMAAQSEDELRERAERLLLQISDSRVTVAESKARFGGGTMPEVEAPSVALRVDTAAAQHFLSALREDSEPIIGYVREDCVWLDLRTVLPGQDVSVAEAVRRCLSLV